MRRLWNSAVESAISPLISTAVMPALNMPITKQTNFYAVQGARARKLRPCAHAGGEDLFRSNRLARQSLRPHSCTHVHHRAPATRGARIETNHRFIAAGQQVDIGPI